MSQAAIGIECAAVQFPNTLQPDQHFTPNQNLGVILSYAVVKPGGVLVATPAPPDAQKAQERGVRTEMVNAKISAPLLQEIANLLDSGHVKTVVAQTFPLSEARQAQELSQSGHVRGKIVLQIGA